MCCNNMWCYTDMSHCEWAVCGYEGFFVVGFIVVCRYSSVRKQIKVHTVAAATVCTLICLQTELYLHTTMKPPPTTTLITTHSPLTVRHICITPRIVTAQYQHEAITSHSRQLLMMGTWLPETCWATSRRERIQKWHLVGFFLSTLNYDARSTTHQIDTI